MNGDDAGSKRLGISHFDNIGFYTATREKLPVFSRVASNFAKKPIKPATFHTAIF